MRAVGVADDRMREDRLRALRAIRFAARFGFAIEQETWSAILDSAPHLGRLSMERVQQEIEKTMAAGGDARRCVSSVAGRRRVRRRSRRRWRMLSDVALATLDRLPRATSAEESIRTANRLTALVLDLTPDEGARAC